MSGADLVLDARCATGESPVWSVQEQALYWADIPRGILHRFSPATAEHQQWGGSQMLACMAAWAGAPGKWIAGLEDGVYQLQQGPGGQLVTQQLASVQHALPGMRFNDGRCDRQGRFLAGTMFMDMAAAQSVGHINQFANGHLKMLELGAFLVPNGMAFSPDGRTMYLSDSHPLVQTIWAYNYDPHSGTPSNQRLFVDMKSLAGRPDGAAVDVDGCYWICGNDAGLVHRFTPDGRLDRSMAVPVKKPAMCAFGGAGLDVLYVASIRPDNVDLSDQPLAGGVFALHPGTQGMAEPAFQAI